MQHHARLIKSNDPSSFIHDVVGSVTVYIDHPRLGVGEVRDLIATANRRPAVGLLQTLVVRTNQITVEAQNALLKVLEEPPSTTALVVVVPGGMHVLDTVLSRVVVEDITVQENETAWDVFRSASIADRLAQIDTWQKQKDANWLLQIQNGLRNWLQTSGKPSPSLQLVVERLNTRGASNKMLLEALSLDAQLQNK